MHELETADQTARTRQQHSGHIANAKTHRCPYACASVCLYTWNHYPEPGVHDSKGHPHNQERADHAGEKFGIKRCAELAVAISHRTICENTDVDTHTHTHTHTQMAHMMTDGHDAPKITSRRDRVSHGELIRTWHDSPAVVLRRHYQSWRIKKSVAPVL